MSEEYEGVSELKDETIEVLKRCIRCRFCFTECPVYEVSEGWLTQGASGITQALYYGIVYNKLDQNLRDILMRCTTCRSCEIICERLGAGVDLVEAIEKGRRLLLEIGVNPRREQQKALESLQKFSNPYDKPLGKKTAWADELDVPFVHTVADIQTLYYVGCTTAYDDRVQRVARSLVRIMKKAEIPFGVLEKEQCCGEPAYTMGEVGLFEMLVEENVRQMRQHTGRRIVTTCPHGFNTFKNKYPDDFGKNGTVQHHTQFIHELIASGRLSIADKEQKRIKLTYHDPCYLGKHNGVYEEPREILKSLPGAEMIEMRRSGEKSLCCGGGGGRMWTDFDEEKKLSQVRVEEALDTGAQLLVTACPFCLVNLEDAVKTMDVEGKIAVVDIAELVAEYI